MCSHDIEDISMLKTHKNNEYSEEQWNIILYEFNKSIINLKTKNDIIKLQKHIQKTYKIVLSNADFIKIYNKLDINDPVLKSILTKKKSKSNSGVIVITVLTSAHPEYIDNDGNTKIAPFSCKWDCHYCPNEKAHEGNNFTDQPRSYLFNEPAVLRANANNFDAILQFNSRITDLINMGHTIDKIELIILGGTWCSYPLQYRERFIKELYYSANTYYEINKRHILSLEEEITQNEDAKIHIIGLTLETRPDTISLDEIKLFRKYNCTRIQLGVQHTNNKVLKKINRGHDIECVYKAIKILKENCYKVDIHLMPNLPGSSYELDREMLNNALYDPRIQADQLKIYPCAIVNWTKIKKWFDEGTFVPYPDELLYKLIIEFKKQIQKYKRINRIIRDIPSTYILGGYNEKYVNLRQLLQNDKKKNNWDCCCIRCREIGNNKINKDDIKLNVIKYDSSDGDEYFISFEAEKYLIGFLRLRINRNPDIKNILPILHNASLVRELHVYSDISDVGNNNKENSYQHKGYGKKLLEEAEKITLKNNIYKIAIISGTGVRNYYRKYGYILKESYMIKELPKPESKISIFNLLYKLSKHKQYKYLFFVPYFALYHYN